MKFDMIVPQENTHRRVFDVASFHAEKCCYLVTARASSGVRCIHRLSLVIMSADRDS